MQGRLLQRQCGTEARTAKSDVSGYKSVRAKSDRPGTIYFMVPLVLFAAKQQLGESLMTGTTPQPTSAQQAFGSLAAYDPTLQFQKRVLHRNGK